MVLVGWFALSGFSPVLAQKLTEKPLPLDGWIAEDGSSVNLTWRDTPRAHRGEVEIARRVHGTVGGNTWTPLEVIRQPGMRVTDFATHAGQAYEYRILRRNVDNSILDIGYFLVGRKLPEKEKRGVAHLVVEASIGHLIAPHLERFSRDLLGDGWEVRTYSTPRHDTTSPQSNLTAVIEIKAELTAAYHADPFTDHAIILVGHVPIVKSGQSNPDGHEVEPHATDLIYGDIDGRWRISHEGHLLDNTLPSDAIEMQVGRIDFAPLSRNDALMEAHLLRAYFDKNHNWRHARLGDLRNAYGQNTHLTGELYGLRNIVGPEAITSGGHHDVGEAGPWLWGVDFGDFNGTRYASDYANKAVFSINFGSLKQKFDRPFNPMTAQLAQPWYPLAVGWGGRPAWWLHHMALGGSVGTVHMRTINNGIAAEPYQSSMEYIPTGAYLWRNPVWVNLLGDPTLRAFPLAPPGPISAIPEAKGVHLSWDASPDEDVLGYRVYKRLPNVNTFHRISGQDPITTHNFLDSGGDFETVYMVRALGSKEVHAGSFRTLSQGVFGQVGRNRIAVQNIEINAPAGESIDLPGFFNAPKEGLIIGFVEGPTEGALRFENETWRYTPPQGFFGTLHIGFVASDHLTSAVRTLTIHVKP